MSFGMVSLFLSDVPVRMRIPGQYFDLPELSLPYNASSPERSIDRMIRKLDYVVQNESRLRSQIREHKARLWELTLYNLADVEAAYMA